MEEECYERSMIPNFMISKIATLKLENFQLLASLLLHRAIELGTNHSVNIEKLGYASVCAAHFTYSQGALLDMGNTFLPARIAHSCESVSETLHFGNCNLHRSHVHI